MLCLWDRGFGVFFGSRPSELVRADFFIFFSAYTYTLGQLRIVVLEELRERKKQLSCID